MTTRTLEDTVVAITGAGQGIGRGIAEAFARAGASLVVSDIAAAAADATAAALRALGAPAQALRVDVRSADDQVPIARRPPLSRVRPISTYGWAAGATCPAAIGSPRQTYALTVAASTV